ncbi:subtilisin-like protein [Hesseltinella vesiculosa]|uniref:Subtilisin-like protein n=1 Tax=Hesseltinella vesiculosa TaxID=101127 RepID=A0A1X2GE56_9FUNG|nr:subtilisin-like protein [Hesseltinella vesiculosa]
MKAGRLWIVFLIFRFQGEAVAEDETNHFETERHHRLSKLMHDENLPWEATHMGPRFTVQFQASVDHPNQVEAEQNAFLQYLQSHDIKFHIRYRYNGIMNGMSVQLVAPDSPFEDDENKSNTTSTLRPSLYKKKNRLIQFLKTSDNSTTNLTNNNGTDTEIFHPSIFLAQTLKRCPYIRRYWPGKRYKRPNVIQTQNLPHQLRSLLSYNRSEIATVADGQGYMDPGMANLNYAHTLTGVETARKAGFSGNGIKVGILDSGVDYTHPSLGGCFGPGCLISTGYDLVGDDYGESSDLQPDENPIDLCDGHGTHVAGILAANDRTKGFEGVAPGVSIGVWRIFGCEGDTDDDIILAAAEMAADAGMDIINLSLGGGVSAWSEDALAVALSNLSKKGISIVVAQGNEGRDGIARTPSPAVGDQVIAVGSVDNTIKLSHIVHLFQEGHEIANFEYVSGDGPGFKLGGQPQGLVILEKETACDPILQNVHDQVVAVKRGECDFGQKAMQVQNAGGTGVLVYSTGADDAVSIDLHRYTRITIPVASVSGEDGVALLDAYHESKITNSPLSAKFISELTEVKTGGLLSVFSTWGPDPELHFKPDIVGVGGHLYSTYPSTLGWYRSMSGTSMATPYISGCLALYMEATGERDPRIIIDNLMNYAVPLPLLNDSNHLDSVARQGPGLIQVYDAILATTQVYPPKIALNDTEHFNGKATLFIENFSDDHKIYEVDHLPTMGVNGYDFNKSAVPMEKAEYKQASALVAFEQEVIEVNGKGSKSLNIKFAPPRWIEELDHVIYGGYIRLRQVDKQGEMIDSKAIHVPYYGVLGSQYELPIFDYKQGYPYIGMANGKPIHSGTRSRRRPAYNFQDGDVLNLFMRLGNPSTVVKCEVISGDGMWAGYIPHYDNIWVARNDHSDEFFDYAIHWHGHLTMDLYSNTAPVETQPGTYHIILSALKIFGNASVPRDWETWTSFDFDIIS